MSGPIIPADKWPEWADRHCWDVNKAGYFYGSREEFGHWQAICRPSLIPIPAGHDWRVPVMRQPAPPIGLEQFRAAVMWWRPEGIPKQFRRKGDRTGDRLRAHIAEADRLLALIDGQGKPFTGELRPEDLEVTGWPYRPSGLLFTTPKGVKITHKPTGTIVTCDTERSQHVNRDRAMNMLRAKLQPTKGEGVAGE